MKKAEGKVTIHVPLTFIARGGCKMIISQESRVAESKASDILDATAAALARAFRLKAKLESGEYPSVADLACGEKQNLSQVYSLLRLSLLAPPIIEGILSGKVSSSRGELANCSSLSWHEQCSILKITC